jgi:hypothetical protein
LAPLVFERLVDGVARVFDRSLPSIETVTLFSLADA